MATPDRLVGIRVDASRTIGVGHAVRMLALAQELRSRSVPAAVFGDIGDVPWLTAAYDASGIPIRPAAALGRSGATHLVMDGYSLPATTGTLARARGVRTMAMIDGPFGTHQVADVYVDQNYGAAPAPVAATDATSLLGPNYAMFRDEVIDRIGTPPPDGRVPRVLAVFGGTDPYGAGAEVVPLLLGTGLPVHVIAVTPSTEAAARLQTIAAPSAGQSLETLQSVPDLPAVAITCDAAVSAAGSTIWELLCLGVPTASVCVVDNQEAGYLTTVRDGVVLAGGRLPLLQDPEERASAVASYAQLVGDTALRTRLRDRGRLLVDGQGRQRVADALLL